ncbi:glycosyltransferase family 2 protein [Aequorivita sp. H23M31]|uniref:Glycosyltransferase family 2 protein n=1 Tax=Aequorivita ciconiae TaxID=2494375 RepID=A0A410G294_9FLAO|nr:glycosyltransferase family A protein [Aequorivita sp. H23M31]QAA81355.1 glycosyltransferase family 2 protein [Aequorivita sp. H23M31]
MIFNFLKYLQPTHYFQLYRKNGGSIFPIVEKLPGEIQDQLDWDSTFKSELARQYDLSWQAIQKGYTGNAETYRIFEKVPVEDEYRFIRKYFHSVWVFYVLMLRLLSFKNPLHEIRAWRKSRNTKKSDFLHSPIKQEGWENFHSTLIVKNPLVSIVIPTLNRYEYLKDVLFDLELQDYKNFEVIIVDQSQPFQKDFYADFKLDIQLIHQEERALWLARNRAIEISKGEYLLLFDDDSRVDPDWITNHLKCLHFFKADISAGVSISTLGAEVPANYSFFNISSQLDTGNVLIKKDVFRQIGLFDRQFEKQRMGDGEFGLRAYLNNFRNISNPYAKRLHLKVGSGGLREMGSWDAFRPKNLFAPRPIPSVLYFFRKYFGTKRALLALLKTVPPSVVPYRYKKNKKMLVLGIFISLLLFPFVLLQVTISWRLATRKLEEGEKIERLE